MRIEVALPVPVRRTFTYEVPEGLRERASRGSCVLVPFGKRRLVGVVLGRAAEPPPGTDLKAVEKVLDDVAVVPEAVLALTLWLADYYQAPPGESVRLALPPSAGAGARPSRAGHGSGSAREEAPGLVRLAAGAGAGGAQVPKGASALRRVLDCLANPSRTDGWTSLPELRLNSGASAGVLRKLQERGLIELASASAPVRVLQPTAASEWLTLTADQQAAVGLVIGAIDGGVGGVFLLRGVTGSGKTEVYFAAARRALDRGRSVLFLVPEIGLTPVFTRRVRERFGDQVALLHSGLAPAEREAAWSRARSGAARLVVGPRSALFAPVSDLGLVVVDEEHDASYKQEETPRYHARDLALVRARMEQAVVVLGSATPSVESWHAAQTGRYQRLDLKERVGGRSMPPIEIVDMRDEYRARGGPVVLSARLIAALETAIRKVGSSRVDLQACKLEYSIVSPK